MTDPCSHDPSSAWRFAGELLAEPAESALAILCFRLLISGFAGHFS
jgi:hypothetical protein